MRRTVHTIQDTRPLGALASVLQRIQQAMKLLPVQGLGFLGAGALPDGQVQMEAVAPAHDAGVRQLPAKLPPGCLTSSLEGFEWVDAAADHFGFFLAGGFGLDLDSSH
jgi:hypothetical protein